MSKIIKRFAFILYFFTVLFCFGFINLYPLFSISTPVGDINAEDIFISVLLVITFKSYLLQRKKIIKATKTYIIIEILWILFVVIIGYQSFFSPTTTITQKFVNLRFVYGFLLFFPTIALFVSEKILVEGIKIGVILGILGTVLIIVQSLHGLENLFYSPFYNIGAWGGNKQIVSGIARVNLPVSIWISYLILLLFSNYLRNPKFGYLLLILFYSIAIILNFARSLWLAITLSLLFIFLVSFMRRIIKYKKLTFFVFLPALFVIIFFLLPSFGINGINTIVLQRIQEGIDFFTKKTGTWGVRIETLDTALMLWRTKPLLGIGTYYYSTTNYWIDLGLPIVLVSIGLLGFVIEALLLSVNFYFGYKYHRIESKKANNNSYYILGISLSAFIVLLLVYQQWLDPYTFSILGVISGVSLQKYSWSFRKNII